MKPYAAGLVFLLTLAAAGVTASCSGGSTPSNGPTDAGPDATSPYAAQCVGAAVPPATIECTGLYVDVVSKTLAPRVQPYAPAVPLWADYAGKGRWIWLPPGTTIDASNPDDWIFPVGTKVWKEFSRDGKRVETRFFEKVQEGYWVRATYAWNQDESEAIQSGGADLPWGTDGGTYHIPSGDECDQCHRGRTDHLLGFEQVSLGLEGATGLTLSQLVAENLITPAPSSTHLVVGDDGTGRAAHPLAWLHINCGVSCHNGNPNATAYGASMRLRLHPGDLDGRSSVDFDARRTTLEHGTDTPTWAGQTRIVPGDPTHSLLVKLITNRGTKNPVDNQMPPIASLLVDPTDTQSVIAWIAAMPAPPSEAGSDASGEDAAVDAQSPDTAGDAESNEAGGDAAVANAGGDAAVADAEGDAATSDGGATEAGSADARSDGP